MSRARSLVRVEYLLPFACAAAAICVGASEFMDTFRFELGPGGEAERTISASSRHSYALLVLAVFALFALTVAVLTGSRPAAVAVAVSGALSLLFFLLVDLPDVGQQGTVDDPSRVFLSSEAEPADGFWLQMIGTVALAVSGAALATLRPEQLRMLVWGGREGRDEATPAPGSREGRGGASEAGTGEDQAGDAEQRRAAAPGAAER